jgi:hypothetical protein
MNMSEKAITVEDYRVLLAKLETLHQEIIKLKVVKDNDPGAGWLDNNELANILRVSKRQLQNYRDQAVFPFSQFGSKIYYRWEDIEAFLIKNMKNR